MRLFSRSGFYRRCLDHFTALGHPGSPEPERGIHLSASLESQAFSLGGAALVQWFRTYSAPLHRLADQYCRSPVFLYSPETLVRQARSLVRQAKASVFLEGYEGLIPEFSGPYSETVYPTWEEFSRDGLPPGLSSETLKRLHRIQDALLEENIARGVELRPDLMIFSLRHPNPKAVLLVSPGRGKVAWNFPTGDTVSLPEGWQEDSLEEWLNAPKTR